LVPAPNLLIGPLGTGTAGDLALGGTWPAGVPSGVTVSFQYWINDPAAPQGYAATNGLRATAP
jgi:hypothetical protein